MSSRSPAGRLSGAAYFTIGLLVVLPFIDLAANLWPWQPGSVDWRFGAYGLLSGYLMTPMIGVAVALLAAVAWGHRRVARLLGATSLGLGILILVGAGLFALDVLQLRASIPPEGLSRFDVGGAKAIVKNGSMAVALVWLGIAAWRATPATAVAARATGRGVPADDAAAVLIRG